MEIGRLVAVIDGDLSGLQRALGDAKNTLQRDGRMMQSAGKALSLGVTAPIVAIGTAAIATGMQFESSMNRVRALSGATGDDFDALQGQAKDLGRTTQFSASQAADAMGFLAMAGFDANEIVGAMPGTLQLAAAAQLDLARAADIVSNILTGYGLEVEDLGRANDVLVKMMTSANVDLNMLGESFKYVGPIAKSAGLEFEEVAAAIALMGNAGIQGSMSGTALRGAITRLLKPTGEVSDTMQKLGLNVTDASGQLLPLVDIVEQLERSGADTADMMALFGQRAGPAMAALVSQGADALRDMTQAGRDAGGIAQEIANVQMEGLRGSFLRLKSAWEGVLITISEMGALDALAFVADVLAGGFQVLGGAIESLPGPLQLAIVLFAGVAAAIGPALFITGMFMGQVANLLPLLIRVPPMLAASRAAVIAFGTAVRTAVPHLLALSVAIGAVMAANTLFSAKEPEWVKTYNNLTDHASKLEFLKLRLADASGLEAEAIEKLIKQLEAQGVAADEAAKFQEKHGDAVADAIPGLLGQEEAVATLADSLGDLRAALNEALAPLNELRQMPVKEVLELEYRISELERENRDLERSLRQGVIPAGYDSVEAMQAQIDRNNDLIQSRKDEKEAIEDSIAAQVEDIEKKIVLNDQVGNKLSVSYDEWGRVMHDTNQELTGELDILTREGGVIGALEWMLGVQNDINNTPMRIDIQHNIPAVLGQVNDLAARLSGMTGGLLQIPQFNVAAFGSHRAGLDWVPYDNYPALLHRGEQVLTATEARDYRDGSGGEASIVVNSYGPIYARDRDEARRSLGDLAFVLQSRGVAR